MLSEISPRIFGAVAGQRETHDGNSYRAPPEGGLGLGAVRLDHGCGEPLTVEEVAQIVFHAGQIVSAKTRLVIVFRLGQYDCNQRIIFQISRMVPFGILTLVLSNDWPLLVFVNALIESCQRGILRLLNTVPGISKSVIPCQADHGSVEHVAKLCVVAPDF